MDEISLLKRELEKTRRERDEARAMCQMLHRHYTDMLQACIGSTVQVLSPRCETITTPVVSSCEATATPVVSSCETITTPVVSSCEATATPVVSSCETITTPVVSSCEATATPVVSSCETITTPVISCEATATPVVSSCETITTPVVSSCEATATPVVSSCETEATPVVSSCETSTASIVSSCETPPAPVVSSCETPPAPVVSSCETPEVPALPPQSEISASPSLSPLSVTSTKSLMPSAVDPVGPRRVTQSDIRITVKPMNSSERTVTFSEVLKRKSAAVPQSSPAKKSTVAMATASNDVVRPFGVPRRNDVLIISDSLMRCIDPAFTTGFHVAAYPVSGLNMEEAEKILSKMVSQKVSARTLVLCVGTNDYHCAVVDDMRKAVKKILEHGVILADHVVISTVPMSYWKGRPFEYRFFDHVNNIREKINSIIRDLADANEKISILPLDTIFHGHTGRREEEGRGWYQRDAVHPNGAGTRAIELCLDQILAGQVVTPPSDGDNRLDYDDVDISWRQTLRDGNYARSNPLREYARRTNPQPQDSWRRIHHHRRR